MPRYRRHYRYRANRAEKTTSEAKPKSQTKSKPSSKKGGSFAPPLSKTEINAVAKSPTAETFKKGYETSLQLMPQQGMIESFRGMFLQTGRETQPANFNPFAYASNMSHGYFWLPKRQPQTIDIEDLDTYAWSPGAVLNILMDVSPDISKSLFNRISITGTEVVFKAVTKEGEEDPTGQKLIDEAISKINPDYGGIETVVSQMGISAFCWGAVATDHALQEGLEGVDDLFVVNPDSIYFERDKNQYPIPYQLQYIWMTQPQLANNLLHPGSGVAGDVSTLYSGYPGNNEAMLPFRRLNLARFTYTPLDPAIDDPYGRSPAWPALQVVFFMTQLLRDLQRVMENQAWPHTDFSLDWEILKDMMNRVSPDELNTPQKLANFIRARISEVQQTYNRTEPRQAYVHPSYLTVTQNVKGGSLEGIDDIVIVVRREIAKALKEVPLFMDLDETVNGDVAAAQFEIYVHQINRMRTIIERHIKKHLALHCWLNGHDTRIVAEWPAIRSTQRLADAQAERLEVGNEQMKRDNGWTDNDQAAKKITGTKAVREPDWEHLQNSKSNGQMGEVASGEDKPTSQHQKASKSSLKSKNARAISFDEFMRQYGGGPFKLPKDHQPGVITPEGGSSCASCRFVSADLSHCSNEFFTQWHESTKLPAPANTFCCDWWEENKVRFFSAATGPQSQVFFPEKIEGECTCNGHLNKDCPVHSHALVN